MVQFGIETYDGCDKFSAETFFLNLVLRHPKFQLSVDTQVVGFLDLLLMAVVSVGSFTQNFPDRSRTQRLYDLRMNTKCMFTDDKKVVTVKKPRGIYTPRPWGTFTSCLCFFTLHQHYRGSYLVFS